MVDVAIVGGGLAGSSAAITLAKAGKEVVLLERELRPRHKVCGEFLSYEALLSLHSLGVDPVALGALGVSSLRLVDRQHTTTVPLPFRALSITRKQLDEALLLRAVQVGAKVLRGSRALQLQRQPDRWNVKVEVQDSVEARSVFIATGKHDLTGRPRPDGVQSGLVGFKMYFRLSAAQTADLSGHIELLLFRGGYGGLQLVEDGSANLGWLIKKAELQRIGGDWENMLAMMQKECPHLGPRLDGAVPLMERPLAVSSIPYGYVREVPDEDLWSLGDQAAVIPSFTGDGMSIALHSGQLAATMYLAGKSASAYQHQLHRQLSRQVALATAISSGLIWPPSRSLLTSAARAWPGLLGTVARMTRIADSNRVT